MFEHRKTVIICSACHSKSDRENKRNERKKLPKNLILSVDEGSCRLPGGLVVSPITSPPPQLFYPKPEFTQFFTASQ